MDKKKPYIYLAGNIMDKGSNLARKQEYDQVMALNIDADIYSPVANSDINDKNMPGLTMEQKIEKNNHLAEEIVKQDCDRLWKANTVVMSPEQNAIGTLNEIGVLYGWKDMAQRILDICKDSDNAEETLKKVAAVCQGTVDKDIYLHYSDIRDTDIPEVGWRRSFSINQFLYGLVLALEKTGDFETFDEILDNLKKEYKKD